MSFPHGPYFNYLLDRSTGEAFYGDLNGAFHGTAGLKAIILTIRAAIETWRAMRRLSGADDAMLADIGVARCNIDWLVHHGRQRS